MEWQIIIAICIAIPVILLPIALVWYLNLGGFITAIKESKIKRAIQPKEENTAG